jgi:hypothetical protein
MHRAASRFGAGRTSTGITPAPVSTPTISNRNFRSTNSCALNLPSDTGNPAHARSAEPTSSPAQRNHARCEQRSAVSVTAGQRRDLIRQPLTSATTISNRHSMRLEIAATPTKHSLDPISNRHKNTLFSGNFSLIFRNGYPLGRLGSRCSANGSTYSALRAPRIEGPIRQLGDPRESLVLRGRRGEESGPAPCHAARRVRGLR